MSQSDLMLMLFVLVTLQWLALLVVGIRLWVGTRWMLHLSQDIENLRHPPPPKVSTRLNYDEDEGWEYTCRRKDMQDYCG
jgi:hypothetical protein